MSAHGYTRHAREKMRDLGLSVSGVNAIVAAGDVIERCRERRGALVYGRIGDREFHVSLVHDPSSYDPRSGRGARIHGGRFNPPDSFTVLYLCLTRACVVAELQRLGERQTIGVEGLLPRLLFEYEVTSPTFSTFVTQRPAERFASPDISWSRLTGV